jgi:hypothetical protein
LNEFVISLITFLGTSLEFIIKGFLPRCNTLTLSNQKFLSDKKRLPLIGSGPKFIIG